MANRLGVTLNELFELAMQGEVLPISSLCTVFAESEVINYIGEGKKREDIAAGVVDSVANKVAQRQGKVWEIGEIRMIFNFRMAEEKDVPKLYEMVRYAKKNVPDPDWFEAEDEGFLCRHIEKEGFTILALDDSKNNTNETIAAFLTVRFPRSEEDNLGEYLDLTEEEMQAVAHLEIAVVDPKYQGNSLQYRLFLEAEKILKSGWKGNPMHYLMATVHPDNRFSLGNMERIGMKVAADVIKYGGKRRYVMWKENI